MVALVQAMPEIIAAIVESLPQIINGIVTGLLANLGPLVQAGVDLFISLITNLPTIITEIIKAVPQIISGLVDAFAGMASTMSNIGLDLVKGIFNGISNSIQWLWGMLKGWASSVVDYIKGLFGINSPSKVMRDTVGVGIAEGVALGITENTNLVEKAMSDMADVISSSNVSLAPEVDARSIDLEALKEKLRPSLDYVRAQLARAQELMTVNFTAGAQLAAIRENAGTVNTTNNNQSYNYTIQSNGYSPKATADAIKNQMTMQRMLFAMR